MEVATLIPEMRGRYPFLDNPDLRVRHGGIKAEDVTAWSEENGLSRHDLYDAVARHLAFSFHRHELTFEFCDAVMNDLHGVIISFDDVRPDLFWTVFEAFDEGEYIHPDRPDADPIETYTRPRIVEIVGKVGD